MSMESLEAVDDQLDIVGAVGMIYLINISRIDGVEFQDIIIYPHQGIVYLLAVDHRGIAEYGDLCLRTVLVAQTDRIADDLCKMRMTGGLTVAGKGEDIGQLTVGNHLLQFGFKLLRDFFPGGEGERRTVVFIETTFAIDTVEGTDLAVGRQQVNAQRDAEAAAMDGAEDRRWIDNCTHNGRKITFFFGVDKINMYLCTRIRKIYEDS